MIERVLVPLDGSPMAEAVLPQVRRILRRRDIDVVLLRAVSLPTVGDLEYASVIATMQDEAEGYTRRLEQRLRAEGVRARGIVRVGPAAEMIVDTAEGEGASLIAMSTHGRTGLSRFVFGSVTEKVLRSGTRIPLIVMRSYRDGAAVGPSEQDIGSILVPLYRNPTSLWILPHVKELARLFWARIILFHVVEAGDTGARGLLESAAARLRGEKFEADVELSEGDPASEIIDACRRRAAGLIAMATHGRTGIPRWILGSVTEKVLRGATVPVFVARSSS